MTESRKQGLSTRSIHGHSFKEAHGSPHLPVYDTTTFAFNTTADLLDVGGMEFSLGVEFRQLLASLSIICCA